MTMCAAEYKSKELMLFEAVSALLSEGKNMTKLRVSEIAERAGIGKGTVYEYFSSREELIVKAVFFRLKKHFVHVAEAVAKEESFENKIYAMLDNLYKPCEERNGDYEQIYLLFDNKQALPEKFKEEFIKIRPTEVDIRNISERLYRHAKEDSRVGKNLPAYVVQTAFMNLLMSYGVYLKEYRGDSMEDDLVKKRLFENLIFALR